MICVHVEPLYAISIPAPDGGEAATSALWSAPSSLRSREHAVAGRTHTDELDRQRERPRDVCDVVARPGRQLVERRGLVERLRPAGQRLPHRLRVMEV